MEEGGCDLFTEALLREERVKELVDRVLTAYDALRLSPCWCLADSDELCSRCKAIEYVKMKIAG